MNEPNGAPEYEEEPLIDFDDEDMSENQRTSDKNENEPQLFYPDPETWVREWLLPTYRRPVSINGQSSTWCPDWWKHAEALTRLEALWTAWEHLRLDAATGMAVWFRDYADPHMSALLDADGPLKGCTIQNGHVDRLQPLPVNPAPDGMFTAPTAGPRGTPAAAAAARPAAPLQQSRTAASALGR